MLLVQNTHAHDQAYGAPLVRKTALSSGALREIKTMPISIREKHATAFAGTPAPAPYELAKTPVPITEQRLQALNDAYELGDSISEPGAMPRARRATEGAASSMRRAGRSKTSFRLALPPPRQRQRIRLRPKLVLQVQQVSNTPRPIPKLDVLPSNYFGSLFGFKALRMLNVAFSRCGPADVVVVPSDSYMHAPAEEDENQAGSDEESEHRELVAAITMPKREESGNRVGEICLARGSRWDATALPNGNYEFVSTSNGIKTVARWVLRRDRRKTDPADSVLAQGEDTRCYTFSIIDPTTRRHPVIGWLNSKGVDVADRYSPAAGLVKQSSDSPDEDAVAEEAVGTPTSGRARPLLDMDDFTRTLIVVSSIFVSLREGWAKNEPLSGPESQPVSSELGPVAVPSPAIVSMRSTESSRGSSLRVARRRSSQISSLLERTSVAFRRSLSLTTRSSRPSSARRNFDPETISKMSSRRSSVLSDGNNMRPIFREVQPLRRSDTISNAQLSRAGQSYLLTNDDAGINASGYDRDGADSYAIMSDPEGDALDTYHGHASTAHRDRGCSPSPEPSSSGNEAAEFIHETVSGPHGRGKKKWRKLGHWLKPKKGKKDDPSQA